LLCTERSLVKHSGNTLTVSPLRCRCWSCAHCAPRRAKELRWQARDGKPTIFLTLTIKSGLFATPDRQAVELAKGWRMLRQYLMRTLGWKSLPFLCVIEKHKSGWPHMHLLLRCTYIDHKLIRRWWVSRFQSHAVFINRLHDQRRAAIYITKYLAKAPTAFEGCKRYWRSRDYVLPKDEPERAEHPDDVFFEAITCTPLGLARAALGCGASVTFDGPKIRITGWSLRERRCFGLQ